MRLFDDPAARGAVTTLVQQAMAAGGPPAAQERLFRWAAGDANWEGLQPALRQRMQATAETFFEAELGTYEGYLPDDATLAAIAVPVMVLVSTQTHGVDGQAAGRLAERLGVEVTRTPGTPWAYRPPARACRGPPPVPSTAQLAGWPAPPVGSPGMPRQRADLRGMLRPL